MCVCVCVCVCSCVFVRARGSCRLAIERSERHAKKLKVQTELQDSWKKLGTLSPGKAAAAAAVAIGETSPAL